MIAYLTLVFLICGFIFTRQYPIAKFKQLRAQNWTLYCHIFSWGIFWGFASFVIIFIIDLICNNISCLNFTRNCINTIIHYFFDYIRSIFPNYKIPDLLIIWSICSFMLSMISGFITAHSKKFTNDAIQRLTGENDLLYKLYNSSEQGDFVQITLSSGKVYVGLFIDNRASKLASELDYIVILPYRSGYRIKDNLTIEFTNMYSDEYDRINREFRIKKWYRIKRIAEQTNNKKFKKKLLNAFKSNFNEDDYRNKLLRFSIVIPISEIVQVGSFDEEAYKRINNNLSIKSITDNTFSLL